VSADQPAGEPPDRIIEALRSPREGTPQPLVDPAELAAAATALRAGHGPVAVDAERASGYRYSQRAYLVQLRRAGAGTFLIDPIQLPDLSPIDEALADAEWILHAASQDLACLAEVGMRPRTLCSATSGWRWARWSSSTWASRWRRATRPRTGRPGRCRRTG
jgi:ribonuclease D